ncbi:16S rRNA (uracil(1498)-N(3))-methyltransferase [Alteraurantiacibacter buctensis]|uniref:Ribosomal RNA small subunit methyltransferase E n=1 Tax=Alteraurantiacibacter buctensis TaxID=1503981 RepID=A0A844YXV6_9SPHN|nr:16S rRNA (uracil(1498)-N(3))-methyltransferase [Alteraurantiacibacter buctensis]MXO71314.1 16S rRNA (uracil(1498)-N(3))-methyltransferase [Alteraurantiacibacter buctensis]
MPATPAWPPRSAPRLFIKQTLAEGAAVTIDGPQAHYLARVMRVGEGDIVILCDDVTGEWAARVVEVGKRTIILEAADQLRPREQVPDFWLCPALLKKDRFDLVLEKASELGVARVVPLLTRRCVADKLNPDRARTILTEAAEQCARTALPELVEVTKLDALLRDWPEGRALFFADEQGGQPAAAAFAAHTGPAALVTGPEGGFDEAERAAIRAHPAARAISLGPRILRGETAALAATALWMGVAGDWP